MNGNAASLLKNIEKENEIEILMAAETGSHSFGLQTPESDQDIRFIFASKNIREYLSIKPAHELILLKNADFEIEGWDLFKASRLLKKSNPGLFEWFHSRTFDFANKGYVLKINNLMQSHYSLRTLGKHYYNISLTNVKFLDKIKDNDKKAHKTLVQVARCYLMLCYLVEKKVLPPLSVQQLLNEINLDGTLYSTIEELFRAKRTNEYFSRRELLKTSALLEGELALIKGALTNLPDGIEMEEELNKIIWEFLGI